MLRQASGEVFTPHGKIRVAWEKTDQGLNVEVSYPANLECVPEPWEEYPFVSLTQTVK
jgi:hypothetical protein